MTNKIGGIDSRPVQSGGDRPVERAGTRTDGGKAVPSTGSNVSITDTAMRLAALERAVAAAPDIDAARVAELRAAIESGRYVVNAERIASRLLDLEQELQSAAQPAP